MEAMQGPYSENDVVQWLKQAESVLGDILLSASEGEGSCAFAPIDKRHVFDKLMVISNVLQFLCERIIPSMLDEDLQVPPPVENVIRNINRQSRAIELIFKVSTPLLLN